MRRGRRAAALTLHLQLLPVQRAVPFRQQSRNQVRAGWHSSTRFQGLGTLHHALAPQVLQLLDLLLAPHHIDGLDALVLGVLDELQCKEHTSGVRCCSEWQRSMSLARNRLSGCPCGTVSGFRPCSRG